MGGGRYRMPKGSILWNRMIGVRVIHRQRAGMRLSHETVQSQQPYSAAGAPEMTESGPMSRT